MRRTYLSLVLAAGLVLVALAVDGLIAAAEPPGAPPAPLGGPRPDVVIQESSTKVIDELSG